VKPKAGEKRRLGLAGLLVELLLPTALSAVLLLLLISKTSFWNLRTPVGLGAFAVVLVVLSLFVSIKLDGFTLAGRTRRGKAQLFNRAGAWSRLVKFALGGVAIPIAAFFVADRVEVFKHETPMSLVLSSEVMQPARGAAERIGEAVRHADTAAARIDGIDALGAMATPEALDQLIRIVTTDPQALRSASGSQALAKALAAFGDRATPKLLELFNDVGRDERRTAAGPLGAPSGRDLSATLAALRREIASRSTDPAATARRLAQLDAAAAQLDALSAEVERDDKAVGGTRLPAFVIETFLAMNVRQDESLLAFARATAEDAGWSDAVRGEALQLVAKLGGAGEIDWLCRVLDGPSPLLRAGALHAVATLEKKFSPAPPR
jgi:hypothetical protein